MKPTLIKLIAVVCTLLLGLLLVGLGLIIAIFAGSDWLYLSLAGIVMAAGASYLLYRSAKSFRSSFTSAKRLHVKTKVK